MDHGTGESGEQRSNWKDDVQISHSAQSQVRILIHGEQADEGMLLEV